MPSGAETNSIAVPTLSYGRERSPRLKRWLKRLGLLLWIAAVLAMAWDKWGVLIRVRSAVVYAQYQLLHHAEPADRIVLESDPAEVAAVATWQGYRLSEMAGRQGKMPESKGVPGSAALYTGIRERLGNFWDARERNYQYSEIWHPSAPFNSEGDRDFSDAPDGTDSIPPDDRAFIYSGGRKTPSGRDWLVVVRANWLGESRAVSFTTDIYPINWTGSEYQSERYLRQRNPPTLSPSVGSFIRIFAGQSDPANPSKILVRYATSNGDGFVEVTVLDDVVDYVVASGPLKLKPVPKEEEAR